MIELPDGTLLLREGEPIPLKCRCGCLYQPELGSECSDCPECGRTNLHEQHLVQAVEEQ